MPPKKTVAAPAKGGVKGKAKANQKEEKKQSKVAQKPISKSKWRVPQNGGSG
jgi:hypothetical protein